MKDDMEKIVRFMAENKIDVHVNNDTPIYIAVKYNNMEMIWGPK